MITIEEIHESLVNGQRKQMTSQIDEYGTYDFFTDYRDFLKEFYCGEYYESNGFGYFTDCVISYHRIPGN